jgi:predicted Fe-Mo cluster-binding NifX family protein
MKSMPRKILIPLYGHEVAPRFDLASEAAIVSAGDDGTWEEKIVVLAQVSAEKLCHMILTKDVDTLICGGIEDPYYQYLRWKRIIVYDSIIGHWKTGVVQLLKNQLHPGAIVGREPESG